MDGGQKTSPHTGGRNTDILVTTEETDSSSAETEEEDVTGIATETEIETGHKTETETGTEVGTESGTEIGTEIGATTGAETTETVVDPESGHHRTESTTGRGQSVHLR